MNVNGEGMSRRYIVNVHIIRHFTPHLKLVSYSFRNMFRDFMLTSKPWKITVNSFLLVSPCPGLVKYVHTIYRITKHRKNR